MTPPAASTHPTHLATHPAAHLGWSLIVLTVAALSLGPSFAHALEAWPRVFVWPPELWRETTVFNGQFILFLYVGAPLDLAAVGLPALFAYIVRDDRRSVGFAVTAAVLYALALIVWASWVAPANQVLASWTPGPVPTDFVEIRDRWESGHIVVAVVKLLGFMALSLAVALHKPRRDVPHNISNL
jgi:hypothetical protein